MSVKAAGVIAFAAGAALGAALSELAEQRGISVSELLRRAVLDGLGSALPEEAIKETRAIGKYRAGGRPRTRTGQSASALPEVTGASARPV